MIRIAFVIDRFFSDRAGTEKQLLTLVKKMDKRRFDIFICCLRETDFLNTIDCCNVYVFKADSLLSVSTLNSAFVFIQFLRENKIDIVQTHFRDSNFFGVLCAKLAGVPTIISSRRGEPYWSGFLSFLLTRFLNTLTDYFIVNSCNIKKFLIEKERVSNCMIAVLANSMDMDRIGNGAQSERKECRKCLGIAGDEFVVGIVAGLRPIKRHDVFIQAASLLCRAQKGWRFVVVGDGLLRSALQALVVEAELEREFFFLGSRDDVPKIVRAFDVGVLCSDYESTSNTVLEYVALEVPVVCTNVGDNPQYVEEGGNGFLVMPGDAQGLAKAILRIKEGEVNAWALKNKSDFIRKNCNIEQVVFCFETKYQELFDNAL